MGRRQQLTLKHLTGVLRQVGAGALNELGVGLQFVGLQFAARFRLPPQVTNYLAIGHQNSNVT